MGRRTCELEAIVKAHREYLLRRAHWLTGNVADARDLVQDTLERACKHFHQFQPGTSVCAWLVTIMTRKFLDDLKHQKVVRKAEPDILIALEADRAGIRRIPPEALLRAIEQLDPELREVVELCYLEELSYREAGERLGVPPGTIGSRLSRAREMLLELLKDP